MTGIPLPSVWVLGLKGRTSLLLGKHRQLTAHSALQLHFCTRILNCVYLSVKLFMGKPFPVGLSPVLEDVRDLQLDDALPQPPKAPVKTISLQILPSLQEQNCLLTGSALVLAIKSTSVDNLTL